MRIVIAGAHGKIARLLTRQLTRDGHTVIGLIRTDEQSADLLLDGAEPVVLDLEDSTVTALAAVLNGADAAVFAAGAGPSSGDARKGTVDLGAAVLLADAAESAGVSRLVQISSTGTDLVRDGARPAGVPDGFVVYLQAKLGAEEDLVRRDLDWTIVRPGTLTDDAPIGRVRLGRTGADAGAAAGGATPREPRGEVPRADVAAVIAELLRTGAGSHTIVHVVTGSLPVPEAVRAFS